MADQKQNPERKSASAHATGPTSVQGLEASELPDKGRGGPETSPGKELARKLPIQTGAVGEGADVGLAATPESADQRDHGSRKRN